MMNDSRPSARPPRRSARGLLAPLAGLALLASLPASGLAAPEIYHSPNGMGTDKTPWPPTVTPPGPLVIYVYIDEDDGITTPSLQNEEVCKDGTGEERCGWDVEITVSSPDDSITIASFTATVPGTISSHDDFTLSFNGGDPASGESSYTKLGELTLNAAGNSVGQVRLQKLYVVDASLGLDKAVEPPGLVIADVPEPGTVAGVLAGAGLLGLLFRARRRPVR